MRPRGQTPRMRPAFRGSTVRLVEVCFNEAAGADPADAKWRANVRELYTYMLQ